MNPSSYVLQIRVGHYALDEHPILKRDVMLGRRPDNDVILEADDISGYHARLTFTAKTLLAMDLGSRNGARLNGQAMSPQVPTPFRPGDVIKIGPFSLRVRAATSETPAPPAVSRRVKISVPPHPGIAVLKDHQRDKYPVANSSLTIGRAPDNAVTIQHSLVSGHHARIEFSDGRFRIVDLDSRNGIFYQGRRITSQWLQDGDMVYLGRSVAIQVRAHIGMVPAQALAKPGEDKAARVASPLDLKGRRQVKLGRASDNDIVLEDSQVSRHHAILERRDGGYCLTDLHSSNGTFLNDKRVMNEAWPKPGDKIGIGSYQWLLVDEEKERKAPAPAVVEGESRSDDFASQSWPAPIFCEACGAKNSSAFDACIRCGHVITKASPVKERQLIETLARSSARQDRLDAMDELGKLKTRGAAFQLLEVSKRKGLKNVSDRQSAQLNLAEVIITTDSIILCDQCGAANAPDAKFCYHCGARVSRPTASPQEVQRLIGVARQGSGEQQLRAIERLGQLRAPAAAPVLGELFKQWGRPFGFKIEVLWVVEASIELGETSIAPRLSKLLSEPLQVDWVIRALIRLNRLDLVMKYFLPKIKPDKHDKERGENLQFVLEAATTCGAEAVSPLCENIIKEKKRWDPGVGYFIIYPNPIAVLITSIISVGYTLFGRSAIADEGKLAAAMMVTDDPVTPDLLKNVPLDVRKVMALRCYSTALSTIADHSPESVKAELKVRNKSLERAVIGLALARRGDEAVYQMLKKLRDSSDWVTRLLAYEGLVVLVDATGRMPGQDQLAALKDEDIRVRTAAAQVMARAKESTYYAPHILALADADSKKQRMAILPVVAWLASNGYPSAVARLQVLARRDSNRAIRESAKDFLSSAKN